MASSRRRTPRRARGVLRHYHRPLRRDRVFLLVLGFSLVATAAFVGVVLLFTGLPDRGIDWLRPGVVGALVFLLSFRLLGMGVTTSRKFSEGLSGSATSGPTDGPNPTDAGDAGDAEPSTAEATGRAAGAVVGRALRSARSSRSSSRSGAGVDPPGRRDRAADDPEATPPATPPAAPTATRSEADRAARAAGAVVGRRLAERRRAREQR